MAVKPPRRYYHFKPRLIGDHHDTMIPIQQGEGDARLGVSLHDAHPISLLGDLEDSNAIALGIHQRTTTLVQQGARFCRARINSFSDCVTKFFVAVHNAEGHGPASSGTSPRAPLRQSPPPGVQVSLFRSMRQSILRRLRCLCLR